MFSKVIYGKECSRLSFMALMRVDTGWLKRAAWMNETVSAIVVEGRIAFAMLKVLGSKSVQNFVLMVVGWLRSVNHNFVRGSRFA